MSAKHTPGPWFISGSMTKYIEARIGCGFLQEVASVGPTVADGGYGDVQQANARLIAAAPELLEALRGMIAVWQSTCNAYGWDASHMSQHDAALAAIAKATNPD